MKIKFLSAIFIPWSKWLLKNGYINIWLTGWLVAEWMNEGLNFFSFWKLLHFLLCQWAIFWSYSKYSLDVGGCNSNLSLINPVQPLEDILPVMMLVQCSILRLYCIWTPKGGGHFLKTHSFGTYLLSPYWKPGTILYSSPLTSQQQLLLFVPLTLSGNFLFPWILPYICIYI